MTISKELQKKLKKLDKEAKESAKLRMSNKAMLLDDMLQNSKEFISKTDLLYKQLRAMVLKYKMNCEEEYLIDDVISHVTALCCEFFASCNKICFIMG